MIKFSHSVFALPFALMAAFLAARAAGGHPSWIQLTLVIVCMVAARSVAMTFNRISDASIDARNVRTAKRAIPAGVISPGQAWGFLIIAGGAFVLACGGFLWIEDNPWPLRLSLPVLGFLCFYSYTKRWTRWSHFVLGVAIGLSPGAAWLAIHPASLGIPALLLMAAVSTWIAGFDIIYACQDAEFDREAGLKSLPALLGIPRALWLSRLTHVVTTGLLVGLGLSAELGVLYGIGVGFVALLLVIEHALVHAGDLSRVNVAFFTVNGVISLVLAGLAVADCLRLGPG